MSIYVQNYVWSLDLAPTTKYVAVALADHAHDDGHEARPSQEFLSEKTGLSVRHVRRCLRELVDLGVIRVERPAGRGRCTVYYFPGPPDGYGRTPRPVKEKDGRTSGPFGRTSATQWADSHDPLTIKNPDIKQTTDDSSENARVVALQNIRQTLRQTSAK